MPLPPTVYNGSILPLGTIIENIYYDSWTKILSSLAFSIQLHTEVRMDIIALLLAAFGLDSFKQNSAPPGCPS
ncbi:hypothetical protein A6U88_03740 [Agrobacterium sp. B131/95]|nr:hypothetical protein A6U88_03740 [Agrobacterium sp. B131/95]